MKAIPVQGNVNRHQRFPRLILNDFFPPVDINQRELFC